MNAGLVFAGALLGLYADNDPRKDPGSRPFDAIWIDLHDLEAAVRQAGKLVIVSHIKYFLLGGFNDRNILYRAQQKNVT